MDREPGLQILFGTRIGDPGFDLDRIQINLPTYVNDEIWVYLDHCARVKGGSSARFYLWLKRPDHISSQQNGNLKWVADETKHEVRWHQPQQHAWCTYTNPHTTLLQHNQCVSTVELNNFGNSSKLAWQVHTEPALPLKLIVLTISYCVSNMVGSSSQLNPQST